MRRLARHDPLRVFEAARAEKMTVFASTGDDGAAQPTCDGTSYILSASTPASRPPVTGVGATHLKANFTTGDPERIGLEQLW